LEKVLDISLSLCASARPVTFASAAEIVSLSLWDCGLTSLPETIGTLVNLTELDLSYNQLDALPVMLATQLPRLNMMHISHNQLSSLPPWFSRFQFSDVLNLSHNNLLFLPDWLQTLQPAGLTLEQGVVTEVFPLRGLDFSHNQLTSLPPWFSTFRFGFLLDLSSNPLDSRSAQVLASAIATNTSFYYLNLTDLELGPDGTLLVIQALVQSLAEQTASRSLSVKLDDVFLPSFEGLGMIPVDILQQGASKIVGYLSDLSLAPSADPLFRSKLMVVGFEGVGKTTFVDCLFPLEGWLQSQGKMRKTSYWFKIQGTTLAKYEDPADPAPHKGRFTILGNRQWTVVSTPKELCITLTPKQRTKPRI